MSSIALISNSDVLFASLCSSSLSLANIANPLIITAIVNAI